MRADELCDRGLKALGEQGRESVLLYASKVFCASQYKPEAAGECLQDIKRLIKENPTRANGSQAVFLALNVVMESKSYELAGLVFEMADMLPDVDDFLKDLLDTARIIADIESLEEKGYPQPFHDMLGTVHGECDCEDCKSQLLTMECYMLYDLPIFRPHISRLKKNIPTCTTCTPNFSTKPCSRAIRKRCCPSGLRPSKSKGPNPWRQTKTTKTLPGPNSKPFAVKHPKSVATTPAPAAAAKNTNAAAARRRGVYLVWQARRVVGHTPVFIIPLLRGTMETPCRGGFPEPIKLPACAFCFQAASRLL